MTTRISDDSDLSLSTYSVIDLQAQEVALPRVGMVIPFLVAVLSERCTNTSRGRDERK